MPAGCAPAAHRSSRGGPAAGHRPHASAYAVPIYHRLGFRATGEAGEHLGVVATPMRLELDPTPVD
ncbi:MAG: GNAT family N-acetyltransferase [Geminicoccaceae bacterium]